MNTRDINLSELKNDPYNPKFRYKLISEVNYKSIGGQGDVEFDWSFFCIDPNGDYVLIHEYYDIPWDYQPSPDNIDRGACYIKEESLSEDSAAEYCNKLGSKSDNYVYLPIQLHLIGKELS